MIDRSSKQHYSFGRFQLHPHRRALFSQGKVVPLVPKALEMLLLLVENRGKVLEKQELLESLWPGSIVEEANLSQTIYLLRRALGEGSDGQQYVETIPKRGYRFVAPVEESLEETARQPEQSLQPAATGKPSRKTIWISLGALALLVAVGLVIFSFWSSQSIANSAFTGPIKSVAVLPFRQLNSDDDNYLGLGMADVLITRLSELNHLVVKPISAIRKYDSSDVNPFRVGEELNVDAVLEGTFQRAQDRLRVTWRLHDVRKGRAIWSGKFDEKFTDIFIVQDSISEQVVNALALNLSREKRNTMIRRYTANNEAYDLYMKGRFWWSKRTVAGLKKAVENFEQAIFLSPNYALAYAGLADCYNLLSILEVMSPQEAFPKAKTAALKALQIDDTLAEAHSALGWTKWVYDWNWAESEEEFKIAIELSPNYAGAYDGYGVCLAQIGKFDEALKQLKQAQQLDPLSLVIQVHIGWVYFYSGKYDLAIEQYQRALEMDPNYIWARAHLSQAYEQKKMFAQAIAELRQVIAASSVTHRHLAGLAHIYAENGVKNEAQMLLANLLERENKQYVSPYSVALVYAGLEQREQAFNWLNKGMEQRAGRMVRLQFDPRFKNLRSDSRFIAVLNRINHSLQNRPSPSPTTLSKRFAF